MLLSAQAYDWDSVTIKANGFIDGIVYNPAAPNTVYMHTDMGGAYRWDQSVNKWMPMTDWIQNNDWSVNYNGVETLAIDPTDANRVYIGLGTYMGNSAVLRSTDGGRTWLRTNVSFQMNGNGPGRNAGERMMVDPNSPNILYYGTRDDGLWKSTNYGASWARITAFPVTGDSTGVTNDVGIVWVVIDKTSTTVGNPSQVIYAGVSTTAADKIYRSLDGGDTWAAITGQPTGATTFPIRAVLTPDGNDLYLTYCVSDVGPNGASNGYVYDVDNPEATTPTWSVLTVDSPHGQGGWSGIAIDPTNPNTIYITTLDRWWPADQVYRTTTAALHGPP